MKRLGWLLRDAWDALTARDHVFDSATVDRYRRSQDEERRLLDSLGEPRVVARKSLPVVSRLPLWRPWRAE